MYAFGGIAFMPSNTVIANCVLNECDLTAYMYGGIAYATGGNTKIYNCVNQDTLTAGAQVLNFAGAIVGLRQTPDLILENNFFYASNNCMDVVGDIVNGRKVKHIGMFEGFPNYPKLIFVNETHLIPDDTCENEDIKTILTKEQMMANCYKVGGEDE